MRVLILHSRYRSKAVSGENAVVDDEVRLLREAGHLVDLMAPEVEGPAGALRAAGSVVWDPGRVAEVRRRIRHLRPDVIHVHNLFPALSPAVIRVAAAEGVPMVMTLHNFRLMCLPATFLRDGRVCEDCRGRLPWPGLIHGCYRGSRTASTPYFASLTLHRSIGTFDQVQCFAAVSAFLRTKYAEGGFPSERILVKPNFAWPAPRREGSGGYFLYLGRLSAEKGVDILLAAWRPQLGRLLVAGEGPERAPLGSLAGDGVEFLGTVPPERAKELVGGARAVLIPSRWYEAFPRAVVEAYAAGVPVVASRIGALPEVVEDGVTGLLAPPDDPAAWAGAITRLLDDELNLRLGEGAYRTWAARYTPEANLRQLEAIYRQLAC